MIDYLKGILISKKPTSAIIECGGIGFDIHITVRTYEMLPKEGNQAKIITHFQAKENPLSFVIFGFSDEGERECFRQIVTVSGIGPKTAMTILSAINYADFIDMISKGNYLPLTSISGVGKKTAERLAVELKDKIGRSNESAPVPVVSGAFGELSRASEVIQALMALGYNRLEADKMIKSIMAKEGFSSMPVEDVIKEVLRGK
jgi:Holliday junction DNA helicase RuvA